MVKGKFCKKCGTPGFDGDYCFYCLEKDLSFDRTFFPFVYETPVSTWIKEIKFSKNYSLAYEFGRLLKKLYEGLLKTADTVVPMPISQERLKERGFNQSAIITWGFLGYPLKNFHLKKVKHTEPQALLDQSLRWKNVKGVFKCENVLRGKTVLLIDDVMTTGATASEAARELKEAGASEVKVLVIAKNITGVS